MNKNVFSFLFVSLLLACNPLSHKTDIAYEITNDTDTSLIKFPYVPSSSINYKIGDSKYAQTVLRIWKDYDNNNLDGDLKFFADSVRIEFANGFLINARKDSMLLMMKRFRSSLISSETSVDTWATLKPIDEEGTWVCVWGVGIDERNDRTKDTTLLNEKWQFNKEDKIAFMKQYTAVSPR
jgi:hypothetical protein